MRSAIENQETNDSVWKIGKFLSTTFSLFKSISFSESSCESAKKVCMIVVHEKPLDKCNAFWCSLAYQYPTRKRGEFSSKKDQYFNSVKTNEKK